ncbi:uncharacterized protein LOC102709420 [Oryza brachyantha]|uniref:Uncharacterized protein n=1 Tax=Oryza brachyantha TaxID=4533 RepID=J3NB01_ORYBR|nr:uncharacterized protein LOC102709420 [Oryza brachyantha]
MAMATDGDTCPIQFLHRRPTAGGGGQWHNIGAAYAAVRFLRPQGRSLVLYSDPDEQRRIVFAYPILPGDAFERMDGETLYWAEPECGDEFALRFLDEAACAAVCAAISPVTPAALDGLAERLAGLRVAREGGASAGGDIAGRLAALSIGPPMNRPTLTN